MTEKCVGSLGYLRMGGKTRGCCNDVLTGRDIVRGERKNEIVGMDVKSGSWAAVKGTRAMTCRCEWDMR